MEDEELLRLAFAIHTQAGPSHTDNYSPMLIWPDKCPCLRKAEVQIEAKRKKYKELEEKDFENLFSPRQA